MAKHPPIDHCMICEALPCECNKKPAKAPRTPRTTAPKSATGAASVPKVTPIAPPSTSPRANILGAMKARAADATQPVVTADTPVVDHDAALNGAIEALWPILHPEEKAKHARATLASRAAAWRTRVHR